jgi:oligosaccharyltransferase complex subunit alpha (ribophorin I)
MYTKLENTNIHGSDIKYGPYENLPPFSYAPVVVHFETNQPFAVAQELVREIEISHWGNVQVTEHYNIVHGGAKSKGEFSRSVTLSLCVSIMLVIAIIFKI